MLLYEVSLIERYLLSSLLQKQRTIYMATEILCCQVTLFLEERVLVDEVIVFLIMVFCFFASSES